jgi:hypothetical protein
MKRLLLSAMVVMQLALGVLMMPAASADPSVPLDLQGYEAELERWSASAARLSAHPEEAASLRQHLPGHWDVVSKGEHYEVSTTWLGTALDQLSKDPKLAAATAQETTDRLQLMLRDARDWTQASDPNSSQARAKLDNILNRREFRSVHTPSATDTYWERFTDWLWKFINRIFSQVGRHTTATKVLLWGVVIALGLAFLGWLVYSLSSISLARLSFRRLQAPPPVVEPTGTWRDWLQQARAAAAREAYRDAVRIIYGAAVRRIADAGTWQVDPSRTHREYVRLLPTDSLQRPPLVAITSRFERVWYGNVAASAVDYEAVLAELESLP